MKYTPKNYQQVAIRFLLSHPVAAVFLDMGLGKTSITLTALNDLLFDRFEVHRVLVIAPLRVARDTWADEAAKWDHLKNLRIAVAVGTEAERKAALRSDADIVVLNRENVPWLIENSRLPFRFDTLVIDELSSFKNPDTRRFRSLMKVRPRLQRVIGLTGTPSPNSLMELWSEFKLLDGGLRLGRYLTQYRSQYFVPDKRSSKVVFSYKLQYGAEEKITAKIADITMSMKAVDVLSMPELVSVETAVKLSRAEREKYEAMKEDMVLQLGDEVLTAANAATLSNKLTQLANGAIYNEDGEPLELHTRKLDALEDLIEAANGRPVLVAYWYKHDRARIEQRLNRLGIRYAAIDSSDSIAAWNKGELPVGLIHPASAGHGLNLQAGGSTLIWFSLTWSLELYQQTVGRLYRQGQTAGTVVVQHIVAEGTIDEAILSALQHKDRTQAALIEAVKAELGMGVRGQRSGRAVVNGMQGACQSREGPSPRARSAATEKARIEPVPADTGKTQKGATT